MNIYDEYTKQNVGINLDNYFIEEVESDVSTPTGSSSDISTTASATDSYRPSHSTTTFIKRYGYIMDKYESDMDHFFVKYVIDDELPDDELPEYEKQIVELIDKMFESKYICGDIKFKNMLIKERIIKLTDFDYRFCFDKTELNVDLYKSFIYFSLLCLLHTVNIKRLESYLESYADARTLFFKSNTVIQYLYLFSNKKEMIKTNINKFVQIKYHHQAFFDTQFHYIYGKYCKWNNNKKNEYNGNYHLMSDYDIINVFNWLSERLLKTN